MPNVWTHFLYGEKLLASALPDFVPQPDSAEARLFRFGCQGPDFLFYHRFLPWQSGKNMPKLGNAMHQRNCGPVLLDMIRTVHGRKPGDAMALYVLGFVTHHVLDRNMHPYVFYRSGFKKWNHQRFEVLMDTHVVKALLGLDTWRTPVWPRIDAGPRLPEEIPALFTKLTAAYYPEWNHLQYEDWQTAYGDMIRAQRLFHDPSGIKRILTFGQITPLVYGREIPPIDVMNEARAEWRHPSMEQEAFTDSVWDMWEAAMRDGAEVLAAIDAYWHTHPDDPEAWSRLTSAVDNRSYETGRACDSGLSIRFADPII